LVETTFTFHVDEELKAAFDEAAKASDRPGSQLLRDFMREYVARAAHNGWFRAEVEEALKEANDPQLERIPQEKVAASWQARRAELLNQADEQHPSTPSRGADARAQT